MDQRNSSHSKPVVAIVGRPNVGKSTLFNRLVERRSAITLDTPGVTRDRHYGEVFWDSREFICVDTGGLTINKADSLEKKVKEQVELAIEEAQVILFVVNGREGLTPEEFGIAGMLRSSKKKVFLVVNKMDVENHHLELGEFYEVSLPILPVSAEHGIGISELLDAVVRDFPKKDVVEKDSDKGRIRVALIGRPNVGKSSLLNYLLGEARAVVHDEPGTTIDVVDTEVKHGKDRFLFLDTAGIRRHATWASKLERFSVQSSLKALGRADVCLLLLEANEQGEISKQDAHVAGHIQDAFKGVLILINKWDTIEKKKEIRKKFEDEIEYKLKFLPEIPRNYISAKTGQDCDSLWDSMKQLYKECGMRVPTSELNRVFESLLENHSPPVYRGKPLKFFYMTQTAVYPPTFIIFVSDPKGLHFSYERYLMNGLRKACHFGGAPLKLLFRKKRK